MEKLISNVIEILRLDKGKKVRELRHVVERSKELFTQDEHRADRILGINAQLDSLYGEHNNLLNLGGDDSGLVDWQEKQLDMSEAWRNHIPRAVFCVAFAGFESYM